MAIAAPPSSSKLSIFAWYVSLTLSKSIGDEGGAGTSGMLPPQYFLQRLVPRWTRFPRVSHKSALCMSRRESSLKESSPPYGASLQRYLKVFSECAEDNRKKAFQSEKSNKQKAFLRRYIYVPPLLVGIFQQHNLPSENVDGIFIQHVMGVDDVAKTFRHLLAFLIIDKPMGKDRLRKRQPS